MEVDASRMPGPSIIPSYPPPHAFDSYTLPSRGWPCPPVHPSASYMTQEHPPTPRHRECSYRGADAESDLYSNPSSSMVPIHASMSSSHQQNRSQYSSRPQYQVSPEPWNTPSPHSTPLPSMSQLSASSSFPIVATSRRDVHRTSGDIHRAPNAAMLYAQSQSSILPPATSLAFIPPHSRSNIGPSHAIPGSGILPRLPPILQVEKQQVTTSATQAASASRRRNEANFICPVPGCGSTFTRRFNLRGHLRSHTEERPFVCEWPGCNKGFARQHDCKRHQALHTSRSQSNVCQGCGKTFSRLDALNRHLRSEGGAECRQTTEAVAIAARVSPLNEEDWENKSNATDRSGRGTPI